MQIANKFWHEMNFRPAIRPELIYELKQKYFENNIVKLFSFAQYKEKYTIWCEMLWDLCSRKNV